MQVDQNADPLLKAIDFGFEVEAFLQGDIGRYLVGRATAEVDAAVEALKQVDAEDPKAIRALQNKVAVAESFMYWLGEAVTAGNNAQVELHERAND